MSQVFSNDWKNIANKPLIRPDIPLSFLGKWPAYGLFVLMLAFPMVLKLLYVKVLLFAVVLFVVVAGIFRNGKLALHPYVLIWFLYLAAVGLFFSVEGLMLGTPGALKSAQVYVLWPIVYAVVISAIADRDTVCDINWLVILSTIFVGFYGITFTLSAMGFLPRFSYFDWLAFGEFHKVGLYNGYIEIAFQGLNSTPFLVPFSLAAFISCQPAENEKTIGRFWLWLALLLGVGVALVSGRRAVYLVMLLSPAFILFFRYFQPYEEKGRNRKFLYHLAILGACSLLLLSFYLGIHFDKLSQIFLNAFDITKLTSDLGSLARYEQLHALLQGWSEHVFLGAGHGASAASYGSVRSETMPWAYELYYLALLYQVGLIGFLAYASAIIWVYWLGIKVIRDGGILGQMMLSCLVGMSCMLVATGTNPYLARFDGWWVIFLPVAVINRWLLEQHSGGSNDDYQQPLA